MVPWLVQQAVMTLTNALMAWTALMGVEEIYQTGHVNRRIRARWQHAYIGAAVGHHTIEGCEENCESAQPSEEQERVKDRQIAYTARCQRCQYSCRATPACAQATINTLLLHLSIFPRKGKLTTRLCRGTVFQREGDLSRRLHGHRLISASSRDTGTSDSERRSLISGQCDTTIRWPAMKYTW